MNATQTIAQEVDRHAKVMLGVVETLKQHILSLPDNPRIKRLGANSFVTNFSSLSSLGKNLDLSAEHHDFKAQYQAIVAALELAQPDKIIDRLTTILAEGRIPISGSRPVAWIRLHEDVIAHVKMLTGITIRWTSNAQWPQGTCPCLSEQTSDLHDSKSAAEAVCRGLERLGFGGDRKVRPIRTWMEPKAEIAGTRTGAKS